MATAANAARQIKDRARSARSIRVLVAPTPTTFAERRSVLQVLEQYGSIEVFRLPPGHYTNFICVTSEASTAQRLISSSPLIYSFLEPPRPSLDDIYIADLAAPETLTTTPLISSIESKAGVQRDEALEQRKFKLHIFPAPEFRHRLAMAGSPLHNAWPVSYADDHSFVAATLRQSLPRTMLGKGLAHWLVPFGSAYRMERRAKRLQVKNLLPSKMASPVDDVE